MFELGSRRTVGEVARINDDLVTNGGSMRESAAVMNFPLAAEKKDILFASFVATQCTRTATEVMTIGILRYVHREPHVLLRKGGRRQACCRCFGVYSESRNQRAECLG